MFLLFRSKILVFRAPDDVENSRQMFSEHSGKKCVFVRLSSTILSDNIVVELPHDFQKPQLTRLFDTSHSLGFV